MVAVTTDTKPRRRSPGGARHLTPVPTYTGPDAWRASVRVVRPPAAATRAYRPPAAPAPSCLRPVGAVRVAPATYRLRRTVAVVVAAALALVAWAALGTLGRITSPSESSASASAPGTAAVVVAPGDTFWSIASRIQPTGDVRPLVDRLVAAHGGAILRVGERIAVPAN